MANLNPNKLQWNFQEITEAANKFPGIVKVAMELPIQFRNTFGRLRDNFKGIFQGNKVYKFWPEGYLSIKFLFRI